ncbi:hypothetical protein BDF19DRAFT_414049 [Syncephalis fuscata]|nr:hypothetical protein BDF19DRAFT_414049 [Syncephalis fuscata]
MPTFTIYFHFAQRYRSTVSSFMATICNTAIIESTSKDNIDKQNPFDWLEGTSLGAAIAAKHRFLQLELQKWQSMCDYVRQNAFANNVNEQIARLLQDVTIGELAWADAIYWSRILEIIPPTYGASKSTMAFLPLIDMCNHSGEEANAHWQLTTQGNAACMFIVIMNQTTMNR